MWPQNRILWINWGRQTSTVPVPRKEVDQRLLASCKVNRTAPEETLQEAQAITMPRTASGRCLHSWDQNSSHGIPAASLWTVWEGALVTNPLFQPPPHARTVTATAVTSWRLEQSTSQAVYIIPLLHQVPSSSKSKGLKKMPRNWKWFFISKLKWEWAKCSREWGPAHKGFPTDRLKKCALYCGSGQFTKVTRFIY